MTWAIKHQLALKLDLEAFEANVLLQKGIPGVAEVVTEPAAAIATDLGPAVAALLGEKEVTP